MSEKSDNWRKDYPNLNSSENSINKKELQAKMYYKFMKKKFYLIQKLGFI